MSAHAAPAKFDDMAARIVRLLSLTSRPLLPAELRAALGVRTAECDETLRWLDKNGYIVQSTVTAGSGAGHDGALAWSLGGRGLLWISHEQGQVPASKHAESRVAH